MYQRMIAKHSNTRFQSMFTSKMQNGRIHNSGVLLCIVHESKVLVTFPSNEH